jgi:hypothetical protein
MAKGERRDLYSISKLRMGGIEMNVNKELLDLLKRKRAVVKISLAKTTLTIMVILSSMGSVHAAPSLIFSQLDFYLDGTSYVNSDWGSVDLTFTGQDPIMYFNLAVNGSWQVQNIPVLSIEGNGVVQTMSYSFSLGSSPGTNVTSLNYDYGFTSSVLAIMPGGSTTASVGDEQVVMASGISSATPPSLPTAGPLVGGQAAANEKHSHQNFPNQEVGVNECVPGAVSNSLQFLNDKHNMGLDPEDITITKMKEATKWGTKGCSVDFWKYKDAYMKANDMGITTRIFTDFSLLAAEIDDGQDVELVGGWHAAAVVGITDLGNGKYDIDIAHDREQGTAGGTKTETITYDPTTGKFSGSPGFFDGSIFRYAVVECPVPAPGAFMMVGLGAGIVGWFRRRRVL